MRKVLTPYRPKARYIPKAVKHEQNLQRSICNYLRVKYPNVIFRSDYASGLHLTMNQAMTHKSLQSGNSWPDLFIYHPSRGFHGMALELKKDGTAIYVTRGPRKGEMVAQEHIQKQDAMLQALRHEGYFASFAIGYDKTIGLIDWYLNPNYTAAEAQTLF